MVRHHERGRGDEYANRLKELLPHAEGSDSPYYLYEQARARAGYDRAIHYGIELLEHKKKGFDVAKKNDQTMSAWLANFTSKDDAENLFWTGRVTVTRRSADFARIYDLTERVIPADVLARPAATELEARKQLLELAARHHGIATLTDLIDYHRQGLQAVCKPIVDAELNTVIPTAGIPGSFGSITPSPLRSTYLILPGAAPIWVGHAATSEAFWNIPADSYPKTSY